MGKPCIICRTQGGCDDPACNTRPIRDEAVVAALEIAATVFEEYGRLNRAKLHDDTPTSEWLAAHKKAERNEQYARKMRAALSMKGSE